MANETTPVEEYEEEVEESEDEESDDEIEEREERPARPTPRRRQESGGSRRPSRPPRGGSRGRFRPRRKVCSFCVDKVQHINYKDVDTLRRFVDDHGKIVPRRKTGTCAKHQRRLAIAIKQARHMALLPFTRRYTPNR